MFRHLFYTLLMAGIASGSAANAQTFQQHANGDISIHVVGVYRYPAFSEATIIYRNGLVVGGQFNYNITLDEMHFISREGDTMALAAVDSVDFIQLNGSRYYYYKRGYLQSIDSTHGVILAFHQVITAIKGNDGGPVVSMEKESFMTNDYFAGNGQVYNIGEKGKGHMYAKELFYMGDSYGHFSRAGKEYLLQRLPQHAVAIRNYLKTHKTNFNDLEDLIMLFRFCRSLPSAG
ncbi:MAG: hypothetical protein KGO82_08525 [Bacteroidota bacterium]|nr:hypothetical protein [Bacteroidota bacterium]